MDLVTVGINHKTAPVAVREKLAFSADEIRSCLGELSERGIIKEGVILSTCNRTEIYVILSGKKNSYNHLLKYLDSCKGAESFSGDYTYVHCGTGAVEHLFRVTSGIDSMIIGEPQILGQAKEAYRISREIGLAGNLLNKVFLSAFHVGKRVRSESSLGIGAVSVSYAAVALAQKLFNGADDPNVLFIGAGETAKLAMLHLKKKKLGSLFMANRTFSKAQQVAEELGGTAIRFEEIGDYISGINLIISATSAREPLFSVEEFKSLAAKHEKGRLHVVDLAVPRDFDPAIDNIPEVTYHDLDGLQKQVEKNSKKREEALPVAEAIIGEEVEKIRVWYENLMVTPLIKALREKFIDVASGEVKRNQKFFSESDQNQLDKFVSSLINKFLHSPTVRLKEFQTAGNLSLEHLEALQSLFDIEVSIPEEKIKSQDPRESAA